MKKTKISEVERERGLMNQRGGEGQKVGKKRETYKLTEENRHAHKACCYESINIDQPSLGTSSYNQR